MYIYNIYIYYGYSVIYIYVYINICGGSMNGGTQRFGVFIIDISTLKWMIYEYPSILGYKYNIYIHGYVSKPWHLDGTLT